MTFYYCGFNGFGQFGQPSSKCSNVEEFMQSQILHVEDVIFSWNNIIVWTGSDLYITGFVDGKPHELQKLDFNNVTISSISCSSFRQNALFVTQSGECWQYKDSTLKKILNFINSEKADETERGHITKVCCGENVNIALSSTGEVYRIPSLIAMPSVSVTDVASGFEHNLLLTKCGRVFTWGSGSRGQLGHGELEDEEDPTELTSLSNVVQISAGGWHSAIVTSSGLLYTWGWNNEGQLGFPCSRSTLSEEEVVNIAEAPMLVPLKSRVQQVVCGNRHTVMLTEDGVWGCGWNGQGQLGTTSESRNLGLTRLTVPEGKIRKLVAGSWSTGLLMDT